jgi:hypothetical protein
MARPEKIGLDYFSHDVDMGSDPNIEYVESRFGLTGYGVYLKLLEKIYRNGYYLLWASRDRAVFAVKNRLEEETLGRLMEAFFEVGLFDKGLFERHGVLTSRGIQKRYTAALERRTKIFLIADLWLCPELLPEIHDKVVYVSINSVEPSKCEQKPPLNGINDDRSTQSKGKETKRNKRKVEKGYSSDSVEIGLAKLLFSLIIERDPLFKANLQTWAVEIDRLIRIDRRPPEHIKRVIRWCQQDVFWQANILSAAKLRKQFPALWLKMEGANGTGRPGSTGGQRTAEGKASGARNLGDGQAFPCDLEVAE